PLAIVLSVAGAEDAVRVAAQASVYVSVRVVPSAAGCKFAAGAYAVVLGGVELCRLPEPVPLFVLGEVRTKGCATRPGLY
ncbi:hypothetical protein ABTI17_19985, partial [Acinetobacter baumannii]